MPEPATGDHAHRKQDDWSQATDDSRHAHEGGLEYPHGPVDAEAMCQLIHFSGKNRRVNRLSRSLQPLDTGTGNDEPNR